MVLIVMILSWRPIYAYLVSKKYPECVSEIKETVDDGSDCDDLVVEAYICLFSIEEVS